MLLNKRQLSEFLGKSERTLTNWMKQGLPVEQTSERGRAHRFESAAVVQWLLDRERGRHERSGLDLNEELARLRHHQANNERIKERQAKGNVIPAEVVRMYWSDIFTSVRARLLALPVRIKQVVPELPRAGIDAAEQAVHEALTELASGGDGIAPQTRAAAVEIYRKEGLTGDAGRTA